MSGFDQVEPEPIELDEPVDEGPKSPRSRKPEETLSVSYQPGMKLLVLLSPLLILPFFQEFLELGIFAFDMLSVAALAWCACLMADCLLTSGFTFTPEKIIKSGMFGDQELPVSSLLMFAKDQDIRLFHASEKNIRESFKIRRFLISGTDYADIEEYVVKTYRVRPNEVSEKDAGQVKAGTNQLAVMQYEKAASAYRAMAGFFIVFPVIALFAVGFSGSFFGLAPSLPPFPIRLGCIVLTIASFFLLRRWASTFSRVSSVSPDPLMTRLDKADAHAFRSAALAVMVGGLGLILFLLFGNALDLYLFLLVAALYFYDCYPRLSTWEKLTGHEPERETGKDGMVLLPRRSLQVSLVLMGALAVMSYGESNHYLYASRKDCQDDWGDSSNCREYGSGGGSGGGGRYYGPRYGSGGGRASRAIGVGTISRGGFGSMGSFHASFGG